MPPRMRLLLTALSACLIGLCVAVGVAEDSPDATPGENPLVGREVNIELSSGKEMKEVKIEGVTEGKAPGSIAKLRIHDPASGGRPMLGAAAIKRITAPDGACLYVFHPGLKCLVSPEHLQDEAASEWEKKPDQPRKAGSGKPSSGKRSPADAEAERRKQNEQKRKEFFDKTGVWLWPELTDEQQAEALAKTRQLIEKTQAAFPSLALKLHETKYYLFLSDMPPDVANLYTSCLDKMHDQLCRAFAIRDKNAVWQGGKLLVVAFVNGAHFAEFEKKFFNLDVPPIAQGLAHMVPSGEVIVSCHAGKDPSYFASVIVHETTHGFLYRYRSPQIVPNWLNEGIAEWVAMTVVQQDQGVRRKVKAALERMKQNASLGENFFTAPNIAADQYGIATAMVDFMLQTNPKGFRELIDAIKAGQKWEVALKKIYGMTPEELAQKFGQRVVGVPMLKP
jgi:hypothetical protein